ncbi:MAG TPA: RING finger protein [Chloroflexota bacterium]|nr:RING finger protein [Chloroflexota bacterium]
MAEAPKPALISVRQTAADSKWAGKPCPKCNNPIEAGQAAVLCPKCYTPQHLDCWRDNGNKCAIDQTPANVIDRTAAAARPAAAAEPAPAAAVSAPAATTAAAPATAVVAAAQQTAPAAEAEVPAGAAAAPAARPAAGRPATNGGGAAARPAAGGGAAARPAAAAGAQSAAAMRSAARRSQVQLTVWPHLLMPEFLSAVLLIMGLTIMSWFVNAPLEEHSNPNRTPNPSKAPWYFLNLQELLLHMHPGLAGVIIPTIILVLLMAIPYIDVTTDDVGYWFGGSRGKKVFWISLVYTTVLTIALIMIDKYLGVRASIENALPFLKAAPVSEIVTQTMVPTVILWFCSVGLYFLISPLRPTVRDVMVAFFTAFAVSWVLMAVIGSAFRGPGQELFWPWAMPARTA